ncbi:MAG: hypothetical protein ACHQX3_00460 [Nitrospirales bacterium]
MRYIVTSAYRALGSEQLEYMGAFSSKSTASFMATRIHNSGGRALVHDTKTGFIIRDTGKCIGQVWGGSSRKGWKSPDYLKTLGSI